MVRHETRDHLTARERMRRQDVQLLTLAKQGDRDALCELGQRYLLGTDGFSQYIDLGLKYLSHPSLADSELSARIIADALPLSELVRRSLVVVLASAANGGAASARLKLGFWRALTHREVDSVHRLWGQASADGCQHAAAAMNALSGGKEDSMKVAMSTLASLPEIDASGTMTQALSSAVKSGDLDIAARVMEYAVSMEVEQTPELCDAVCIALVATQNQRMTLPQMDSGRLQSMLEDCVKRGNSSAALVLGRALCGIDSVFAWSASLTPKRNVRGGTALLFRAADAGIKEAWLLLYRVHAYGQGSVANPQAARFFLEKAASSGDPCAQRQLGASILKSALDIEAFEAGMHWMTLAANQGDAIARNLLGTFVLPIRGERKRAFEAIDIIARLDPGVAHRLRIARDFGLTRTEAICVDIASGSRPWGFVVSKDAADERLRSRFSRAIPALESRFLDHLREAAEFFGHTGESGSVTRGERRLREHRLKYVLELCDLDESLFFAQVPTATIATLRQGASWAHSVKKTLRTALAK